VGDLNALINVTKQSIKNVTNEIETWKEVETAIMKQSSRKRKA
jgi:hypothetical protein